MTDVTAEVSTGNAEPTGAAAPPRRARAARWAAALLAAAALTAGGWYALDRVDSAANRVVSAVNDSTDRVVAAVNDSADRQVDTAIEAFNTEVENRNRRIRQSNDLLDSMSEECFRWDVNGAIQQNGCFLQYIAALTGSG